MIPHVMWDLPQPGIEPVSPESQGRFLTTGPPREPLLCIYQSISNYVSYAHACMLSCFSWVRLFATPCTVACQCSLSMGFSKQEYWSGLPCPHPGDLPNPGLEPMSPVSPAFQLDSLPLSHQGSPCIIYRGINRSENTENCE